MSFYVTKDYP